MSKHGDSQRPTHADKARELTDFVQHLARRMAGVSKTTPLPTQPLSELREVPPDADRVAVFEQRALAAGVKVRRVSPAELPGAVVQIAQTHNAKCVWMQEQTNTALTCERVERLQVALAAAQVACTRAIEDETLFVGAQVSVTGVVAAIAETGTIVCVSGPDSPRGATLIVPVHVAIVAESQIHGDLFDYFESLAPDSLAGRALPANLNMITGPSKTADIEGILVTGVHGPGHVHVLLTP